MGCHGPFLGEDFQAESLPMRQVNAWPVVEREEDPATGESRTLGLGGFIYHHAEPENDAVHAAAFPFYWHAREGAEARTYAPPFYLRTVRDGETHGNVLGAIADWRESDEDGSSGSVLGVGPVAMGRWKREADGSAYSHVLPLWVRWRDKQHDTSVAFPLYWRFGDPVAGSSRTLLFPLVHTSDDGQGNGRFDVLWPLFGSEVEGPAQSHWGVLGYLTSFERTDPEHTDFRVLYKLFRHRQDGARRETSFTPFFTRSRDDDEQYSSFSLLWPLYRTERRGEVREHRLFHFIRFGG